MTMDNFTTERERALIAEYRIAKKQMMAVPVNQDEFKKLVRRCNELHHQIKIEQSAKARAKRAVEELDAPALEAKVYHAFKTIFIILAITTLAWVYVSGDSRIQSIPTQVLLMFTAATGLIYFLGYICRTR